MSRPRIKLQGNFVEGFLYFDFLWLLTLNGEVWAFDIGAWLTARVADADDAIRAFASNNVIARTSDGRVLPGFESRLRRQLGTDTLEVDEREVEKFSYRFDLGYSGARSILDFRCYFGRAFVATDDQVRQLRLLGRSDLQHMRLGGRGNGALGGDKISDLRVRQLRTNSGLISAAAGPDGAWYAGGGLSDDPNWRASFRKFADRSVATEVVAGAMTNIEAPSEIGFFDTEKRDLQPSARRKDFLGEEEAPAQELTSVLGERSDVQMPLRSVLDRTQTERRIFFNRVFLSKSSLFAVDLEHRIYPVRLSESGQLSEPSLGRGFPSSPGRVLSITFVARGRTVAELDESVQLLDLSKGGWEPLFDSEVYSVRGYPGSKWYQNLITCVGENRTDIVFIA